MTLVAAIAAAAVSLPAYAQQRPLVTEDPQVIGPGQVLFEAGVSGARDQAFPASGLEGTLWRVPVVGLSVGLSSIAELQIDGGFYDTLSIARRGPAPLASLVQADGDRTHDVSDVAIGTKIQLVREAGRRPAVGFRFSTKLPNASNQSGLGLDTMDFHASLLGAKTVQSIRVVGNVGLGILGDPVEGHAQNDVFVYGASVARALTSRTEFVSEINGRVSTRRGEAFPGTETRGLVTIGGRYTHNALRLDAGAFFGLTPSDPSIGFTAGFTYVVQVFDIP